MRDAKYFAPNEARHPDFAAALRRASEQGVIPLALTCHVTTDSIKAADFLEIRL
jgi:sugar fermentation stimulation protein A